MALQGTNSHDTALLNSHDTAFLLSILLAPFRAISKTVSSVSHMAEVSRQAERRVFGFDPRIEG